MSNSIMQKLLNNALMAEKKLGELKIKLDAVKRLKIEHKIKELVKENEDLSNKVAQVRDQLIKQEILNGKKQYPLPGKTISVMSEVPLSENAPKKVKKESVKKAKEQQSNESDIVVDVRKLDFRIGKIIEINKHPDADSLYIEKIECGEDKPRTVVSGLVNHVPIEEMRDRIVMILCNLKPAKMRGITSEAMVMCASSPEKVEVLSPPNGAVPGDLVTCEGYPREPEPQLNPKKKIFESCAPYLKTNNDKVACFKDSPLVVEGKGPVTALTLRGVNVK